MTRNDNARFTEHRYLSNTNSRPDCGCGYKRLSSFGKSPLVAALKRASVVVSLMLVPGATLYAAQLDLNLAFLSSLGGSRSYAYGLNDLGQVVGSSSYAGTTLAEPTLWTSPSSVNALTVSAGVTTGTAYGINDAGQIAGSTVNQNTSSSWATRWTNGTPTLLGSASNLGGNGLGINGSGTVVGSVSSGQPAATAWVSASTVATVLAPATSVAYAINDAGQVVGQGSGGALLWSTSGGAAVALDPTSPFSIAYAINNAGVAVGNANAIGGIAAVWAGGKTTTLAALPNFSGDIALAINDGDDVVGVSGAGNNEFTTSSSATLWTLTAGQTNYQAMDLNMYLDADEIAAGWHLYEADGINNEGEIIGNAFNSATGVYAAFELAPAVTAAVPEPGTWAMMILGLGWLAYRRGLRVQCE